MINYICVYKTGGDYTPQYVKAFYYGMTKFLPHGRVICFTDDYKAIEELNLSIKICSLLRSWVGWWSKLEIFRESHSDDINIFFDLDTQIIKPLPELENIPEGFFMLKPFNKRNKKFASGIMGWKGIDVRRIYSRASTLPGQVQEFAKNDQDLICKITKQLGINVEYFNNIIPEIYSYKHHCKQEPPKDCKIVCYHGKPRPMDLIKTKWIGDYFNV